MPDQISTVILAAAAGDIVAVEKFLAAHGDVNTRGIDPGGASDCTALILAAERGDLAIMQLLLDNNADVNAGTRAFSRRDNGGWTGLHYAAGRGDVAMVRMLLTAGANPNARTTSGETPLSSAVANGDWETITLLLNAGASAREARDILPSAAVTHDTRTVNHPKYGEITQTKSTSDERSTKLVEYLLENGADINGADEFGHTALHGAAYYGNCALIELLLKHGANVNALEKQGCTPLDRAEKFFENKATRTQTLALLRGAGGKRSHKIREAVETRKKEKRPVRSSLPPRPDFSEAAGTEKFREQLRYFHQTIGTQPQSLLVPSGSKWLPVPGGNVFAGSRTRLEEIVEEEHAAKLRERVSVYMYLKRAHIAHTDYELGFLPTTDKYQVVLAIQPYGINAGVSPQDVMDELRKIEVIQPFHLIAIGIDQVVLRFIAPVADYGKLASALEKFPAEIISLDDDDYLDSTEQIAAYLRGNPRIRLLWEP